MIPGMTISQKTTDWNSILRTVCADMQSNEYLYCNKKNFPAPYMSADVSLIFKDGDDMNKGNFRLVNILLMTKYVIIFVRYLMHYYLPVGDITVVRQ